MKHTHINTHTRFFITAALSLILTRIVVILFFLSINTWFPSVETLVMSDKIHHFYIGVALIAIGIILRKYKHRSLLFAIGTGMILEEQAVILCDIGITEHGYHYLNPYGIDAVVGLGVLGIGYVTIKIMKLF